MNRNGWIVCIVLLAIRMVCLADYVELTATDGIGATSFNTGLHWQNGISPADEASTNLDFLIRNGKQMRTPDSQNGTSYTFGGKSLTLGDPENPSSKGELSFKTCNPFGRNIFEGSQSTTCVSTVEPFMSGRNALSSIWTGRRRSFRSAPHRLCSAWGQPTTA